MRRALVALLLFPTLALADTVYLKNGRTLSGVIVERSKDRVVMEIGPGRVGVPLAQIERIVASSSPLAEYQQRAARIERGDAAGWLDLAAWADANDLRTQAREAYERVAQLQPGNVTAQAALGRSLQNGQWLTFEEGQRARGLVEYEGAWVTPAERAQIIAANAGLQAARASEATADARAREAEARAQEAQARAREAEANAQGAADGIGLGFFPPVVGGGLPICQTDCGANCGRPCVDANPSPVPAPQPTPHTRPHRNQSNPLMPRTPTTKPSDGDDPPAPRHR
jgi:hypothetical protein